MPVDLQTVLTAYQLDTLIKSTPIIGGTLHKSFHAITEKGEYVIKQLNQDLEQFQYWETTEAIARAAKEKGFPARTAFLLNQKTLFKIGTEVYAVYPYLKKQSITLTEKHITQIAQTSAQLHQLKLQLEKAPAFPAFMIQADEWQEHAGEFASLLKNRIPQFLDIQAHYQQAFERLKQHTLISHRDFTPANLLWQDDASFTVIDWELAGFINPELEMLSNAIDVAIMNNTIKARHVFYYLNAYKTKIRTLIENPMDLIYGCLGSWVFWILFCLKRHNHTFKPIDTEKMIRKTYSVIDFLLENAKNIELALLT